MECSFSPENCPNEVLNMNNKNNPHQKIDKCIKLKVGKDMLISKQIKKETKISKINKTLTREDLQNLCDQLSTFNKRVKNIHELVQLRYDLPKNMRDKLEIEAGELDCLYKEIQSAASNVETIQNQRAALQKEKFCIKSELTRLKADAINELEVIVSVYDAPMLERWTLVKASESETAAENFLQDVKGKLQAMKNLKILGSQKLLELQEKDNNWEEKTMKDSDNKVQEERGFNLANYSQTSLSLLVNLDSEEFVDDSLKCDQVLQWPAVWIDQSLDLD